MPPLVDSLFETYGAPQLEHGFGELVRLLHGTGQTELFTATWENVVHEVFDSEGFATQVSSRDFMFHTTVATLDGTAFEPRAGDRIAFTENGTDVQFELLPVANLPAAELMPGGYRWNVRTKRVG